MSVRHGESALRDLAEILAYLDKQSPAGGRNVMRSIQRTVESIAEYPERGAVVWETIRAAQAGRYPFRIYWKVEGGEVTIVHIRHTARQAWRGGSQ